jgi:hypothetical protein
MKKILCFFGAHLWDHADDDGWSLECQRCGRFLIPTPAGDLINVNWFKFWFTH